MPLQLLRIPVGWAKMSFNRISPLLKCMLFRLEWCMTALETVNSNRGQCLHILSHLIPDVFVKFMMHSNVRLKIYLIKIYDCLHLILIYRKCFELN